MKRNFLPAFIFCAVVFIFSSCSKPEKWYADLDKAKTAAAKREKDIFLLFSGDDWTDYSLQFKDTVTGTQEFLDLFGKDYVFVNIDISSEEFTKSGEDAEPGTKEYKEIQKLKEIYTKKNDLCMIYDVSSFPSVYLLSYEGYVLSAVAFDESIKSALEYKEYLSAYSETVDTSRELINNVRSASGVEKVVAIEEYVNSTSSQYLETVRNLVEDVEKLDPQNESGLRGKFDLYTAFYKSREAGLNGEDMALPFDEAVEKGNMDSATVQFAYYNAGSFLAASGSTDFERIVQYLEKSKAAAPESEFVSQVERVIEAANSIMLMIQNSEIETASESLNTGNE